MSSITDQIISRLKELRDQMRSYGLIMGAALIFIELVQFMMHNNITALSLFLIFVVKVATMFIVSYQIVKRIKSEFFTTGMSYAQAFSVNFRLFVYGSLLVGVFSFVLHRWLAPNYQAEVIENTMNYMQGYLERFDLPETQMGYIEDMVEEIEEAPVPSPLSAMWGIMWGYLVWGAIVGFILSFFTRDKDVTPYGKVENTES